MMPRSLRLLVPALVALMLLPLAGCQNGRAQQERDALWLQNQELQEELDRARAANDALEAELGRIQAELAAQPEPAPAPAAAQPYAGANTAFSGIEGVETIQTAGAVTVRVPGDILFAPGKADLKTSAQRTLDQIATVLQREYPNNTIRIEGYTDTDPIRRSKWTDNLELSLHRAAAVHRYLQRRGVDADRMYAAGFGEARPRATKAQSRRVEIVVVQSE